MTIDNEKNIDQTPQGPNVLNPRVQRLNLARQMAQQSQQYPGLIPRQDTVVSREVIEALGPVMEHKDVPVNTILETMIEELERANARLDRISDRMKRLELRRNQRRN